MVLKARPTGAWCRIAFRPRRTLPSDGLTGEAVAANLADRLAEIDGPRNSFRSPETMSVNWGDDIQVS